MAGSNIKFVTFGHNAGGGIKVDVITLTCGMAVVIDEDGVGVYRSLDEFDGSWDRESEPLAIVPRSGESHPLAGAGAW